MAVQNGNANIVEMLCSVKAHLDVQDNAGRFVNTFNLLLEFL